MLILAPHFYKQKYLMSFCYRIEFGLASAQQKKEDVLKNCAQYA